MKEAVFPSTPRTLCAVVPAAGRGTRLGANTPKVFVPLLTDFTIWDALRGKLAPIADRLVLVLSPEGQAYAKESRANLGVQSFEKTEIAVQASALGMGDAIFGAFDFWAGYDDLLIVWGDQFNLSPKTLESCLELHAESRKPALTLPVVRMQRPYVEYVFDAGERLTFIRQSREGDECEPNGFSDVGMFLLSGGARLNEEWSRFRSSAGKGSMTGEINFLPFFVYLSSIANWPVNRYESHDPSEAIGINTPEDLAFARQLLQKTSPTP
jgi:bifunctional UDP-N-acetylglucosamine pyrophosphorylase / glucosamine-1-phosphate N-acetyltransferase